MFQQDETPCSSLWIGYTQLYLTGKSHRQVRRESGWDGDTKTLFPCSSLSSEQFETSGRLQTMKLISILLQTWTSDMLVRPFLKTSGCTTDEKELLSDTHAHKQITWKKKGVGTEMKTRLGVDQRQSVSERRLVSDIPSVRRSSERHKELKTDVNGRETGRLWAKVLRIPLSSSSKQSVPAPHFLSRLVLHSVCWYV